MPIEQALYDPTQGVLARSPGFAESHDADIAKLAAGFGTRPAGVACPLALFARPLGRSVAVVRVVDGGTTLRFHFLLVPTKLYQDLGGDPFLIADAFPVNWDARDLPSLEWTAGAPPRRTVEEVRRVLDVLPERTQTLLGGAQALLDGGRLAFRRAEPDPTIVRDLWALLPYSTRSELWPATFAFSNALGFHVAIVPDDSGPDFTSYVLEADAGDYPEGRYEHALHVAAERGDQEEIDALFTRRSRSQMLRMALWLLAAFVLIPPLVLRPGCDVQPPPPKQEKPGE